MESWIWPAINGSGYQAFINPILIKRMMVEKTKMLGRSDPLVVVGMIRMRRKLVPPTEVDFYPAIQKQVTTILVFVVPAMIKQSFLLPLTLLNSSSSGGSIRNARFFALYLAGCCRHPPINHVLKDKFLDVTPEKYLL